MASGPYILRHKRAPEIKQGIMEDSLKLNDRSQAWEIGIIFYDFFPSKC